jgi:hypothetical protein
MGELGVTGLKQYGGIIQDDFLREWRGAEAYKRANEMRLNSPVLSALLTAIEQAVAKVELTLTSDVENDPRLELWDLQVEQMRGGLGNHLRESLTFLPFGFSLFEIVWGRVDGKVIAYKLAPRGQDTVYRWLLDDNGELEGFTQQAAPKYTLIDIPIEKLLHYRFRPERDNPEGRSILRSAWIPYYYAKNIQQIEAIGIERDLAGLPVVTMPEGADTDESDSNSDYAKAAKLVRNIRQDEQAGVVLPSGWVLALLSTGGSRQFDTDKIINRYESRMLMSALAQFLMLGQEGVGSLALSRDQSDLFTMSVNATADIITDTLQAQLLPRLMRLNGYDSDGLKLTHSPAGDTDMAALADLLQKVGSMLTWTVEDEVWLRNEAGLPAVAPEVIEEEREIVREEKRAAVAAIARKNNGEEPEYEPEEEDGDDTDELNAVAADYFAARPDAAKKRKYERELQQAWKTVFSRLKGRVVKGAKKNGKDLL